MIYTKKQPETKTNFICKNKTHEDSVVEQYNGWMRSRCNIKLKGKKAIIIFSDAQKSSE